MQLEVKMNLTPLKVKELVEMIKPLTNESPPFEKNDPIKHLENNRFLDISKKIEDAIVQVEEIFQYVTREKMVGATHLDSQV